MSDRLKQLTQIHQDDRVVILHFLTVVTDA